MPAAMGASGSISALTTLVVCLEPNEMFTTPYLPRPLPAYLYGIVWLVQDLHGAATQVIAVAGHASMEAQV